MAEFPTTTTTSTTANAAAPPLGNNPMAPAVYDDATGATCPTCRAQFAVTSDANFECQFCRCRLNFRVFPRLTKELASEKKSEIASADDATCQFYPDLKAEVVCDECGSFMSTKASVNWAERLLCMPCLHTLREKKADTGYRAHLKIWDNRALGMLALLPITLFTAPVALFLLIRFRNEPKGWVPRTSFRWWLAMFFAIVTMLAWVALIVIWIAMVAREIT